MKNKFFILAFAVFVASGSAFAGGDLSWGALQINPYLNLSQQYRDNIYLEAEDETSDLILFITPGASLYLPTSSGEAELDYSADFLYYRDNSRNDTQRHLARF